MYRVIVFDLDQTLWWCVNTWIDMSAGSPFSRLSRDVLVDRDGDRLALFADSRRIIEELVAAEYTLAVASRSSAGDWAREALDKFELSSYFAEILIFPGSKIAHFAQLKQRLGCAYSEMLFFDDERRNIDEVEQEGVACVHVRSGIEYAQILRLL